MEEKGDALLSNALNGICMKAMEKEGKGTLIKRKMGPKWLPKYSRCERNKKGLVFLVSVHNGIWTRALMK